VPARRPTWSPFVQNWFARRLSPVGPVACLRVWGVFSLLRRRAARPSIWLADKGAPAAVGFQNRALGPQLVGSGAQANLARELWGRVCPDSWGQWRHVWLAGRLVGPLRVRFDNTIIVFVAADLGAEAGVGRIYMRREGPSKRAASARSPETSASWPGQSNGFELKQEQERE